MDGADTSNCLILELVNATATDTSTSVRSRSRSNAIHETNYSLHSVENSIVKLQVNNPLGVRIEICDTSRPTLADAGATMTSGGNDLPTLHQFQKARFTSETPAAETLVSVRHSTFPLDANFTDDPDTLPRASFIRLTPIPDDEVPLPPRMLMPELSETVEEAYAKLTGESTFTHPSAVGDVDSDDTDSIRMPPPPAPPLRSQRSRPRLFTMHTLLRSDAKAAKEKRKEYRRSQEITAMSRGSLDLERERPGSRLGFVSNNSFSRPSTPSSLSNMSSTSGLKAKLKLPKLNINLKMPKFKRPRREQVKGTPFIVKDVPRPEEQTPAQKPRKPSRAAVLAPSVSSNANIVPVVAPVVPVKTYSTVKGVKRGRDDENDSLEDDVPVEKSERVIAGRITRRRIE